MSYIAFVSSLPTETNNRDGYYRRVQNVESVFADQERIHLDIRFWRNFRKKIHTSPENMRIMQLHAFFHFFTIFSALKNSGFIYIHSIAKIPGILIPVILLRSRIILVLDLHGVLVDEFRLAGKTMTAMFYSRIERYCFKRCQVMVYVTEEMKRHYQQKYPFFPGKDVIFYTNTAGSLSPEIVNDQDTEDLKKELHIGPSDVVFIYSGNCQAWQNVDLMLDCIRGIGDMPYKLLILSGQHKKFLEKIKALDLPSDRVIVLTVEPEDLARYYQIAHYGIILRDDILVNRVANPTKLTEYLEYGLVPVVKLAAIGDYLNYQYEYVDYKALAGILPIRKSEVNRQIYRRVSKQFGPGPLRAMLLGYL